jgi:sugar phosphate isomerase/epimerase
MRSMMLRNDLTQFAATGLRCNITPMLANHAGSFPGRSIPEVEAMLTGVPQKAFQYCFDPAQAVIEARSANGWEAALQAALPRLGAVAISDVAADKDDKNAMKPCPMGEGAIDWKKFFSVLADARFHGPVSLHRDYESKSEVSALRKDLAFVRTKVDEAWPLPATN